MKNIFDKKIKELLENYSTKAPDSVLDKIKADKRLLQTAKNSKMLYYAISSILVVSSVVIVLLSRNINPKQVVKNNSTYSYSKVKNTTENDKNNTKSNDVYLKENGDTIKIKNKFNGLYNVIESDLTDMKGDDTIKYLLSDKEKITTNSNNNSNNTEIVPSSKENINVNNAALAIAGDKIACASGRYVYYIKNYQKENNYEWQVVGGNILSQVGQDKIYVSWKDNAKETKIILTTKFQNGEFATNLLDVEIKDLPDLTERMEYVENEKLINVDVVKENRNDLTCKITNFVNGSANISDNGILQYSQSSSYVKRESINYQVCIKYCPLFCKNSKLNINNIKVPNVITPNGDGVNDYLIIEGLNGTNNRFEVYNQYGAIVYYQDDYQNKWNGTTNAGNNLPAGVYYTIIKINNYPRDIVKWFKIIR